jgi:DNA-binding HxlR family transcriptional regulator
MEKTSFADMPCSMAKTLDIVGEWWSLLIIRDIFIGIRRFNALRNHLGIARNMLSRRLQHLEESGITYKLTLENGNVEHRLTEAGIALYPILLAFVKWGDEWVVGNKPPSLFVHNSCGHTIKAQVVCDHCGEELTAHNVSQQPGPSMSRSDALRLQAVINSALPL